LPANTNETEIAAYFAHEHSILEIQSANRELPQWRARETAFFTASLDRKRHSVPREAFPNVPIGEVTVTRPFTAPGLFAYRHMQAKGLLHFPDFGDGDMNKEQRKDALERMVNVHRPLAALVLFLGVVGLEDFIRDLGARLADVSGLERHFPKIAELRPVLKKNPLPYAR